MTSIYNSPINFNISKVAFRSNPAITYTKNAPIKDGFVSNPLVETFINKSQIELEARQNAKIKALFDKYNLPIKVNDKELEMLRKGHLNDTRIIAAKIYSSLPEELKSQVNMKDLQEAALLHDYGKALIPPEILNKNGALNETEKEIMELHSEIGYELLKNKGISENSLNLIKHHHQNPAKTGYPTVGANYEHGIDAQVLSTADKYSALREARSYKNAMTRKEALDIIEQDVKDGIITQEVYTALKKAV